MTEEEIKKQIHDGREFMKLKDLAEDDPYQTDQELKRPQPPLTKAAMTKGPYISLPVDFSDLDLNQDVYQLFLNRKSNRIYDKEKQMSILQLSWLLWATQGVKSIRGKSYATIRTVASGGARHPFETYLLVRNIETLNDGLYHYLPMEHALECIKTKEQMEQEETQTQFDLTANTVCGQTWAGWSNVLFLYSVVPYRAEWRYGIFAHRPMLMDSGHITGNLYLACSAADLGTCAIAAVDEELCNRLIGLDGEEEFVFYAASVGLLREQDQKKEADIYAFVKEQGL